MAKNNTGDEKKISSVRRLNKLFRDSINANFNNLNGTSDHDNTELKSLSSRVEDIINKELSDTKSITSDDMSVFLVKLFNDNDRTSEAKSIEDIFEGESAGLFQFFQQRYQNQNLLYEDLNVITSQLFELDEAIMTTRDAIVTSDDITKTISRTLNFSNASNISNDEFGANINTVTELETELKLLTKIKNLVIPNTLTYGTYYAYVCPYSKLFQEQYDRLQKDPTSVNHSLSESVDPSFISELTGEIKSRNVNISNSQKDLSKIVESYASGIEIYNDIVSIPLIEGVDLTELIDASKFNKKRDKYVDKAMKTNDGVVDTSKKKSSNGTFDNSTGCYIKFIEPKKMIPIKILDTVLGYYYIHDTDYQVNKSPFSTTIRVTNTSGTPQQHSDEVENIFMSKITDKIVKSFDKPFLEKNAKFKDLILNALLYNDMYKKEIKFQFIPADYVVEFKVNEDTEGNGQSILTKSLFYAKLYLALLIFKMVSIITKSNDTRIYYVKNSGIDQSITNKIQEVARSIRGRQINFMDLLNYNSIISKIGANKELFMPVGRSGERGIEFDTLAGQDVPLNTDLMEMLRTNMINGTGVPSVIMNYVNEADYAKTLTMANSKFVGRVISYQLDLNEPITEFYKLVMKFSNLSLPDNVINAFEFKFNPPKTLNTVNMSDLISNSDQIIAAAIKAVTGENADQTQTNNRIKDKVYNTLIRNLMPMLDWAGIDEAYRNAKIEVAKEDAEAKVSNKNEESE